MVPVVQGEVTPETAPLSFLSFAGGGGAGAGAGAGGGAGAGAGVNRDSFPGRSPPLGRVGPTGARQLLPSDEGQKNIQPYFAGTPKDDLTPPSALRWILTETKVEEEPEGGTRWVGIQGTEFMEKMEQGEKILKEKIKEDYERMVEEEKKEAEKDDNDIRDSHSPPYSTSFEQEKAKRSRNGRETNAFGTEARASTFIPSKAFASTLVEKVFLDRKGAGDAESAAEYGSIMKRTKTQLLFQNKAKQMNLLRSQSTNSAPATVTSKRFLALSKESQELAKAAEQFIPLEFRDAKVALTHYIIKGKTTEKMKALLGDRAGGASKHGKGKSKQTSFNANDDNDDDDDDNVEEEDEDTILEGDEGEGDSPATVKKGAKFRKVFEVVEEDSAAAERYSEKTLEQMEIDKEFFGSGSRGAFFERFKRIMRHQDKMKVSPPKAARNVTTAGDGMTGFNSNSNSNNNINSYVDKQTKNPRQRATLIARRVNKSAIDSFLNACFKAGIAPEPSLINRVGGPYKLSSLLGVERDDTERRSLDLSNYGLGDKRIKTLSSALLTIDFISKFNLSYNRLTSDSVRDLMHSLTKSDSIIELNLSGNKLDTFCCEALTEYIKSSCTVEKIVLDDANIGDKEVKILMDAFTGRRKASSSVSVTGGNGNSNIDGSENKTGHHYSGVTSLSLRKNNIGSIGGTTIANLIEKSTCSLQDLDLSFNQIMGVGAQDLGTALNYNTSLVNLDLSVNRFGDSGCVFVGSSFATNKHLKTLNLEQNNLGTKSAYVIASNLRRNNTLETVLLMGNNLGEQGGRSLFRAIFDGVKCFAIMTGCSFAFDSTENFDYSSPDGPYKLDLEKAYDMSIFHEVSERAHHACRVLAGSKSL